uniref:Gamma-glutamylcyclotransferase family protein n=1 Tax=Photinus pyralis TaxID=7054 RepID=A0A1Y1K5K6_PHOPY
MINKNLNYIIILLLCEDCFKRAFAMEQNFTNQMASSRHYVFVYGTLKTNEPNHHWFYKNEAGHSNFICNAQTIEKYPLIIATRYNVPFLLHSAGVGHYVKGEIYEVDDIILKDLDELEEHPTFYVREEHFVKCIDGSEKNMKVWIYFIKQFNQKLLNLPMLDHYTNEGEVQFQYVPRYDRNPEYDIKQLILL